jgi:type IV secretion system protein TrbD
VNRGDSAGMAGVPRLEHVERLAAALGLGLQQWVAGLLLWAVGHSIAVLAAKRDPDFVPVLVRHLRQRGHLAC